jgi:hypothetical protein
MRSTLRISVLCSLAVTIFAATAGSQETLRIVPSVNGNRVVVSFELNDAYTDAVREGITSGLRTTFTYDVHL